MSFINKIWEFTKKQARTITFFFRRVFQKITPKEKKVLIVLTILFVLLWIARFYEHLTIQLPDTPHEGGTYKEATFGEIKSLNPFFAQTQVEKDVSSILFLKLLDLNNQGKWKGILLSKVEVGQNEATLQIRDNAYWQNGDSVTSDDFIFTVNLFKNVKAFSLWQQTWKDVSVKKVSDKKITLTYPDNGLTFKNLRFALLPNKILGNMDLDKIRVFEFNIKPIADGPYQFKSIEADGARKIITLERNSYYSPKPYIDKLQFYSEVSLSEAVKTFKATSFTSICQMPIEEIPNLKDKRVSAYQFDLPQYSALFYNLKKQPFDNQDTRINLDLAIDRDQIISDLKYVKKTTLPLPAGITDDKVDYNPSNAKKFLEPRFSKKQFTLSFPDSYIYRETAQDLKNQFAKVGVNVNLDAQPDLVLWQRLVIGDYQMALWSESVGNDLNLNRWYSTNDLNFSSFSDENIDNLLANASKREDNIAIAKAIKDLYPASFLYSAPYVWASRNLRNVGANNSGEESSDRFLDIASWYLTISK